MDLNDSSEKKQQCDKKLVKYTDDQSLPKEKMSQVIDSLTDKIFASFSLSTSAEGGETSVEIEPEAPEKCRQKESDREKKDVYPSDTHQSLL